MVFAIELRGITKRFPGVCANDHIDLAVEPGEIRALVGENGAGKTTLMRILYGLYAPDEGEIRVKGIRRYFRSPLDAIRSGLGMVHQQFMLFPSFTVAENVVYGAEPRRFGFLDRRRAESEVANLATAHGFNIDPATRVGDLPVGVQQQVEILKMLYRRVDTLILDEPTAVLTPQERDGLFAILRHMATQGTTVLLITHKLDEVMRLSDRATVLRGGKVTGTLRTADTSPEEICRYMVGRDVLLRVDKQPAAPAAIALKVDGLTVYGPDGLAAVKDVSFEVRGGEIVGIAGVAGNGQTELAEAVTGLRKHAMGAMQLRQARAESESVGERRRRGLVYIPEDRLHVGMATTGSTVDNLLMGYQHRPGLSRHGLLQRRGIVAHARSLIERFDIKAANPRERCANLSGGNMQKLVIARELSHDSWVLVAEQPTRGVDVGSIEFIHRQIVRYRDEGRAVLLISADLSELMGLSDRILVMFEGRIVGEVDAAVATEQQIGLLMAGHTGPAAGSNRAMPGLLTTAERSAV